MIVFSSVLYGKEMARIKGHMLRNVRELRDKFLL
jgi:hypothetical protein